MTDSLQEPSLNDVRDRANPAVSVVIPHYMDLQRLDLCLDALSDQTLTHPYEIIVVDNASPMNWDAIEACVGSRAKLVLCNEKGAGPARNAGLAVASADRLAFIDSDCIADHEWLRAGCEALERFDFVGGQVEVLVDDEATLTPVECFERVFAFRFEHYIKRKHFTGSGNLFAKRIVFDTVGGFKPAVSEDVEWSHRAIAGGFRLGYAPAARVGHPARRSWDDLAIKWRRTTREAFELARMRRGGRILFMLRGWAVLFSIVPHAFTITRSRALTGWRQRLAAMRVLVAIRAYRFLLAHRLGLTG